jgi:hypothetical protein
MLIRVRWNKRTEARQTYSYKAALGLAALLTPLALGAFTMGLWSIAAELGWTEHFAISHGALSHWEVWLAVAAILLFVARLLNRYGEADRSFSRDNRGSVI